MARWSDDVARGRLENSAEALADYLRPVLSGLGGPPAVAPQGVIAAVSPFSAERGNEIAYVRGSL